MTTNFTPKEHEHEADIHAREVTYAVKVLLLSVIGMLIMILKSSAADSTHISAKKSLFIQFAGVGNSKSVNFENVFRQGNTFNYSYSVGFAPDSQNFSVPLTFNAFTKGKRHHFEMGLAVIPYVEKHVYSSKTYADEQMFIKSSVGYRYQKATSGLFIKAGVGPQLFLDPPSYNVWACSYKLIAPSGQLAVGVSF